MRFPFPSLSLSARYSAAAAALLLALLALVAGLARAQLRRDLGAVAQGRAQAAAQALAAQAGEALAQGDELSLAQLLREALEQAPGPGGERRNEGVQRIVLLRSPGGPGQPPAALACEAGEGRLQPLPAPPPPPEPGPEGLVRLGSGWAYLAAAAVRESGTPLGELQLYLRRDAVDAALGAAGRHLGAAMLLAAALGLLLLRLAMLRLLKPLPGLLEAVGEVAAGRFELELPGRRRDELGDLERACRRMAASLAQRESVSQALARYTSRDLVEAVLEAGSPEGGAGRRVEAVVLFSALPGSGELCRRLPPEDYLGLVNLYLEAQAEAVAGEGGRLDKFMGDKLMAAWILPAGAPEPELRRSAARALAAAAAMRRAVGRLDAGRREPLGLAAGLHCGPAVAGNVGCSARMDHTLLGGTVNLAARLGLQAARPGQVLLSGRLRSRLEASAPLRPLGPTRLKGLRAAVELWQLEEAA